MRHTIPKSARNTLGSASAPPTVFHADFGIMIESAGARFSTLSEKGIKRQGSISVKDLEESIEYFPSTQNANSRPFRWYRKAAAILASVDRAAEAARPKA